MIGPLTYGCRNRLGLASQCKSLTYGCRNRFNLDAQCKSLTYGYVYRRLLVTTVDFVLEMFTDVSWRQLLFDFVLVHTHRIGPI